MFHFFHHSAVIDVRVIRPQLPDFPGESRVRLILVISDQSPERQGVERQGQIERQVWRSTHTVPPLGRAVRGHASLVRRRRGGERQ